MATRKGKKRRSVKVSIDLDELRRAYRRTYGPRADGGDTGKDTADGDTKGAPARRKRPSRKRPKKGSKKK